MKRQRWNRLAKLLAALAIAGVAATWALGQVRNEQAARSDKLELARMTEKMKTVCVGRFLLDFPEEARIEFSDPRIDGFSVVAFRETLDEFQARLAEHEAQIKAKPDRLGGNRNLEVAKEVRGDGGMTGKLFVHNPEVQEGTASNGLKIEPYRYEGVAVEALMHGNGVSVNLASDFYFPDKVGNVLKLAVKLVPNPENIVPADPGFCMDGAYLRDTLRLRGAPRTISGIPGEELVERVHELNDAIVYSFWWEVPGTTNDIFVPRIVFQMDTGEGGNGPVPSSLSQAATLRLWDKISSSIRWRPSYKPLPAATP